MDYSLIFTKNEQMKKGEGFKGEKSVVLPDSIIDNLRINPLTKLLYVTDIGYYPNAKFHFRERTKGIAQHVLIYCVEGEGSISSFHNTMPINIGLQPVTHGPFTGCILQGKRHRYLSIQP